MKTMLSPRIIYITEADMRRLRPLIEGMKNSRDDLRGLQADDLTTGHLFWQPSLELILALDAIL